MILSFKTKINGKPTYFPEKILKIFSDKDLRDFYKEKSMQAAFLDAGYELKLIMQKTFKPKIHTIRKDDKNRWKQGMMIDFFINARQKDMFRFAPRIPLKDNQRVYMTFIQGRFEVSVDDKYMYYPEIEKIAINDGFDSYEDFRDYFISEMVDGFFGGYILHWTDFKY